MPLARLAALVLALAVLPAQAQEAVSVQATPIEAFEPRHPEQTRFGPLRFIGGLQLESRDKRFGGLSGIEISPDGRQLVLVSDVGDLFSARLDYDAEGRPSGLESVTLQRLVDENGMPLGEKFGADAESLRAAGGRGLPDTLIVGFERDNRALAYTLDDNGRIAQARAVPMPATVAGLPFNKGLEGLAVLPRDAAVVAFQESERDGRPDVITGWIIRRGDSREIELERSDDFDLTDAVALPNGDLIIVERRFNMATGVAMRLRRIGADELAGDMPIAGEVLFTAGMSYAVDNMEGLAVHTDAAGRTILTVLSDDNFSALQRTLLLQFELLD